MLQEIPFDWKQELLARLDLLGSKVGAVSGQVWESLLRQQRIEFFMQVGSAALIWVISLVVISIAFHARKNRENGDQRFFDYSGDPTSAGVFLILGVLASIAATVTTFVTIWNLDKLMNPEYAAFKQLLEIIRR